MLADSLQGERFGRLAVLSRLGSVKGRSVWLCRCDCGNEKPIIGKRLKNGDTQSCGCLRGRGIGTLAAKKIRHKIGERIGSLMLLERVGFSRNGGAVWQCRCDCGAIANKSRDSLTRHVHKNCGGLVHQNSHGQRYPDTPIPYPDEAAAIASKYLPLLQNMNAGWSEDIASEAILRASWIIYYRERMGYPIEQEKAYILGVLRISRIKYLKEVLAERNGVMTGTLANKTIGIKMTNLTSQANPVAKAETQGDFNGSTKKRIRFIRR